MSELKADKTFVFGEECEAYKKSEADKVIAEKDKEIAKLKCDIADLRDDKKLTDSILDERNTEITELKADYDEVRGRLQTANLIKDEQLAATRYQKYKRCLNKAEWCDTKADWYYGIGRSLRSRVDFFIKWRDKWLKIAEKFKEAK